MQTASSETKSKSLYGSIPGTYVQYTGLQGGGALGDS